MTIIEFARRALFFTGLALLPLSVILDARFASDATQVPEPASLSLLALGGALGIVVSLIRRPQK